MAINYDPANSFFVKLKYLKDNELQDALCGLDRVIVSGRSISKKEFLEMRKNEHKQ